MPKLIDLTGRRFGRLIVLSRAANQGDDVAWFCLCDCGTKKEILAQSLRGKLTVSCGCHRREELAKSALKQKKHGLWNTPEHQVWRSMRQRCYSNHKNYGGRGIKICKRWEEFKNFYEDMGPRPTPKHSIDRIDFNGHYEPGNCRWATWIEQANNRRKPVRPTRANAKLSEQAVLKGETHEV